MQQKGFAHLLLILVLGVGLVGGYYYYQKQNGLPTKLNELIPQITNTPQGGLISQETKTIYLNHETNKFVDPIDQYSFEYPSKFYLEHNRATNDFILTVGTGNANVESLYGGLGESVDNEGTKYSREFVTKKGYNVKQVVTIKDINHPQGLGTVNSIIYNDNSNRKFFIVAFIQTDLIELQKKKNLNTLTEEDFLELLNGLEVNNQILDSLEFHN